MIGLRHAWLAGLAVSALIAWLLRALPWPAHAFAFFLLVPLPALAILQMRWLARLDTQHLARIPVYVSSTVALWLLASAAILAASASGFTPQLLGLKPVNAAAGIAWAVFAVAAAIMLFAFQRFVGWQESPQLLQLLPTTWSERTLFVLLSLTAGLCEEVVFRGFLVAALNFSLGNLLLAAAVSSLAFGVLHAYQRPIGAARAAVLGFVLAIPLLATGSVWPSVTAHATIDLLGGLFLVRHLESTNGSPH